MFRANARRERHGGVADAWSLFERAPIAWMVLNAEGVVRRANKAAATLFQRRKQTLVGRELALLARVEGPAVRALLERARRSKGSVDDELTLPVSGPEKGDLAVQAVVSRTADAAGRDAGFHVLFTDVTTHKLALDELRVAIDSERRQVIELESSGRVLDALSRALSEPGAGSILRVLELCVEQARAIAAAESGALGVLSAGRRSFDHWVCSGSSAIADDFGASPRPAGALALVALEGRAVRLDRVAAAGDAPGSFLGVPISADGETFGCLCLADKRGRSAFTPADVKAIESLAARAGRMLKILRTKQEDALERAWLDAVFDQMPEAVFVADDRGAVRRNQAARHLGGLEGMGPQRPFRLLGDLARPGGEECPPEANPIVRALARGEKVAAERFEMRVDGERSVPVVASAAPIHAAATAKHGAVAIVRDLSELTTLERLREGWISVVAHELRQPLGTILLALGPLGTTASGDPDGQAALRRIRASVHKLNRLVGDLADDTAIRAGALTISTEVLDLRAVVAKTVADAEYLTAGHRVELVAPRAPLPQVRADQCRLEQVLTNLLGNAAKYGEAGGSIRVAVELRGSEVVTRVSNRGRALTPAEQLRVFERAYRTPGARSGRVTGLGLGLFVARSLIEAHGGRIGVESLAGRTTFWFSLPIAPAAVGSRPRRTARRVRFDTSSGGTAPDLG